MKRRAHHSQETRDRMRHRNLAHWTEDERAKCSERTRQKMANPAVRERISQATKEGMTRWRSRKLEQLREAWQTSDKSTRAAFFAEIATSIARDGA